jgi:hypothetical protein
MVLFSMCTKFAIDISYYLLSLIDSTPRHAEPPLSVMNVKVSCPAAVKVGATPFGHMTEFGHIWVNAPPLTKDSTNPTARLPGVLSIAHVVTSVEVALK